MGLVISLDILFVPSHSLVKPEGQWLDFKTVITCHVQGGCMQGYAFTHLRQTAFVNLCYIKTFFFNQNMIKWTLICAWFQNCLQSANQHQKTRHTTSPQLLHGIIQHGTPGEMLSVGAHVSTMIKKGWIGGFANLVHVGGTETIMCCAHSLRGKIDNNYHHPLGDWKE